MGGQKIRAEWYVIAKAIKSRRGEPAVDQALDTLSSDLAEYFGAMKTGFKREKFLRTAGVRQATEAEIRDAAGAV